MLTAGTDIYSDYTTNLELQQEASSWVPCNCWLGTLCKLQWERQLQCRQRSQTLGLTKLVCLEHPVWNHYDLSTVSFNQVNIFLNNIINISQESSVSFENLDFFMFIDKWLLTYRKARTKFARQFSRLRSSSTQELSKLNHFCYCIFLYDFISTVPCIYYNK